MSWCVWRRHILPNLNLRRETRGRRSWPSTTRHCATTSTWSPGKGELLHRYSTIIYMYNIYNHVTGSFQQFEIYLVTKWMMHHMIYWFIVIFNGPWNNSCSHLRNCLSYTKHWHWRVLPYVTETHSPHMGMSCYCFKNLNQIWEQNSSVVQMYVKERVECCVHTSASFTLLHTDLTSRSY